MQGDESDAIEIECQLSIVVNGQQTVFARSYRLTPADLTRDAPERFAEMQVAGGARDCGPHIRAIARFRRLR